uniref:Uncharacterized protein n=1 Tax=Ditylenchus dipsaci TaxID=166011 RepID=A0A915D996_9BILA
MWYEYSYSGIIMCVGLWAMMHVPGPGNWLDTGRLNRRNLDLPSRCNLFKRDHRMTGNYYKISGIESIND